MKTEEWQPYANEQKRCGGLQKEEKKREEDDLSCRTPTN